MVEIQLERRFAPWTSSPVRTIMYGSHLRMSSTCTRLTPSTSLLTVWVIMEMQRAIKNKNNQIAFMDPRQISTLMVQAQAHNVEDSILHFVSQHHFRKWIFLPYNHSFHWVLIAFNMSHSTLVVFDSMDKEADFFTEINAIIDRVWDRFRKLICGTFKEKHERIYNLKVDKQKMGTNLCAYFYMDLVGKKPHDDMIKAIQEQLIGFINERILDPAGEFYMND
uniref:Ubiquitin-like protease family profile domain-containing protein n=1 Tax=Leersia perrieri TaxID=77586 RepID=A0A0D9WNS9_9ORYZ